MSLPRTLPKENGYTWYQCNCCPYGYHIDLDFVRYCETIQQVERSGSIKRRKDRRRQRQSMEVLLGLTSPLIVNQNSPLPTIADIAKNSPRIQDELNEAVSDFEKTLQRSKNKLSHNLPDVTAVSEKFQRVPSISSMSSTTTSDCSMTILHSTGDGSGGRDFDTISIESCSLSPIALQNIREQMALSLERTKELEQIVKMVPTLQTQLASLKEENRRLQIQLKTEEELKLNKINSNYIYNHYSFPRKRSQSFSSIDDNDDAKKYPAPPPPPRRDFGVMASVLTRNIGVGHQSPNMKHVSTTTKLEHSHSDRWFDEKNKLLNGPDFNNDNKPFITKGTQTFFSKEKRDKCLQTIINPFATKDSFSQTEETKKVFVETAINATINVTDRQSQYESNAVTIGVSDNSIDDVLCSRCNVAKTSIAVGSSDFIINELPLPISLAALSVPRSKSFNLGEEKLNKSKTKSTSSQHDSRITTSHKYSQSEIKTSSKQCQSEIVRTNKGSQSEYNGQTKGTDTVGLGPIMKHKSCECTESKAKTAEVACNTAPVSDKAIACLKCNNKEKEDLVKKEEPATPSRIPRPQIPTTPVENRKFKRQDTYTKIYSTDKLTTGLSALELVTPPKTAASEVGCSSFEKVTQKLKSTEIPNTAQNAKSGIDEGSKPIPQPSVSENSLCQPPSPRKKCTPSKEMQAALKVLNDHLHKSRDLRGHLKNANAIVEEEWFRISSTVKADPVDVEDYIDCFEEYSSILLEYIVNMVDASGNTAMHYAVSHGNFDVVSILLDSKVCDINKQNKAGYTSVMLVSLAEIRSQTHANVVKRLFSLADVNIRAKQYGQTALMLAVSHGRLDMVTMLLEAGADVNIQDEDGSTALMCAAEHGHVDIVKHILSHPDCDSTINDMDGSTALKIAMEAGHRHIGVLLYAHERNQQGNLPVRPKKSKSTSASPKTPSSPLMQRSVNRALQSNK